MKICFFETEVSEQLFFETVLGEQHELVFASDLLECALDAEIFCLYIHTLVVTCINKRYYRAEAVV